MSALVAAETALEDGLHASLAGVARLVAGEGQQGLKDMLRHVAGFAVHAIPGADGAGVRLHDGGRLDIVVTTTQFVGDVEAVQYGSGEGPCVTAVALSAPGAPGASVPMRGGRGSARRLRCSGCTARCRCRCWILTRGWWSVH